MNRVESAVENLDNWSSALLVCLVRRVVVKDGTVTVFNKEHPDGFNPDKDKEYSKSFSTTNGNVDVTVQPGQVFVMGDNRGNSLDSRYFGPIDDSTIVGKLGMRIFPLNKARTF